MSEASIQSLTTPLPNEEPFIGDAEEGEILTNSTDGRIWVFDEVGAPTELGGACVNRPLGSNLYSSNYLDLDVTNPDNLPIPLPNPLDTPAGVVREVRILIRFPQNPLTTVVSYFDYDVDWGEENLWNPTSVPGVDTPVELYSSLGSSILLELTVFGPMPSWMGRVVWAK